MAKTSAGEPRGEALRESDCNVLGLQAEFGSFEDEVLNAEWLPRVELQLGLQPVVHRDPPPAEDDAEAFLKNVYRSQE
jgi:hypothetical protein